MDVRFIVSNNGVYVPNPGILSDIWIFWLKITLESL